MSIEFVDVPEGARPGMGPEEEPEAVTPEIDILRAEIRQTRAELGETVQALAAKADVKARASKSVEDAVARLRQTVASTSHNVRGPRAARMPIGLMIAGVAALAGVILIVRGRRR